MKNNARLMTRLNLYLISTAQIYAALAIIGGIEYGVLMLYSLIQFVFGAMSMSDLKIAACGLLILPAIMLLIAFAITLGRTRPSYRFYKRQGICFPECLKGKFLYRVDEEHYVYADKSWFVAAMAMGASALCADLIDFSVPVAEKTYSVRGSVVHIFGFGTKNGRTIHARLGRRLPIFEEWVQSHGGTFESHRPARKKKRDAGD